MTNRRTLVLTVIAIFVVSFRSLPIARAQSGASLTLMPATLTMGLNQLFSTDIVVNAGPNEIGGVGAVIKYDAQHLQIDHIEPGSTFDDYPLVAFDNESGKAAISGIVGSPDNLLTGTITVGKIFWRGNTLGDTTVEYDYTPGSTTDSNVAVTTGTGDALSDVSSLSLTVVQDPQPGGAEESTQNQEEVTDTNETTPFEETSTDTQTSTPVLAQVGTFFNRLLGREVNVPQIDPYQPITRMPPKTTFAEVPETETAASPFASPLPLIIGVLVILAAIITLVIKTIQRKKRSTEPAHVVMDPVPTTVITPPTATTDPTQVPPVPPTPDKPVI